MKDSFIKKTALDYGLNYETVRHMFKLYGPSMFYEKLEEIISLNKNSQVKSSRP